MKFILVVFALSLVLSFKSTGQNSSISFEQWISLKQAGNPLISPDGNHILYSVTSTDWKENSYDTEYWLIRDRKSVV